MILSENTDLFGIPLNEYEVKKGDSSYSFFHVTNYETPPKRVTATKYKDPVGIYLFYKDAYIDVKVWEEKKYRWDAQIKSGAKILDLDHMDQALRIDFLEKAGIKLTPESISELLKKEEALSYSVDDFFEQLEDREPANGYMIYELLRAYFSSSIRFASFWKKYSYDVLSDEVGEVIYTGEPQAIVLNPQVIEWGERTLNQ